MDEMSVFVKGKQENGVRQLISLGGLAGNPFRNNVGIFRSKLLCELSRPIRIKQKIVDGWISVTIYGISENFAVPADSCDMPSISCQKFFNDLLDSIYFLNLDGIRDETFQIGDGPPFPVHFLSHGRDRIDLSLKEKEKNKYPDPVSFAFGH
jgi:hypothetical protein